MVPLRSPGARSSARSCAIPIFLIATIVAWSTSALAVSIKFHRLSKGEIRKDLTSFKRKNGDREVELRTLFQKAGCAPAELEEERVRRKDPPNITCVLPGESDSVIIVGAHTDHADEGQGVVDDWSGAALLPALLQSLSVVKRRHTFIFIGFTDEEKGLWGSEFYVKHLSRSQKSEIRAVVNLECLGLTPTKVWVSRADKTLLQDLVVTARSLKFKLSGVNVDYVGDDDTHPFLSHKIPVITIHSVTQQTWSILHSPKDNLSAINFGDYYRSYSLILAYLGYLDAALAK